MQDCGAMLWSKLDSDILKAGGDRFEKQRKKLGQTYGDHICFDKLTEKIKGFRETIPLIQ